MPFLLITSGHIFQPLTSLLTFSASSIVLRPIISVITSTPISFAIASAALHLSIASSIPYSSLHSVRAITKKSVPFAASRLAATFASHFSLETTSCLISPSLYPFIIAKPHLFQPLMPVVSSIVQPFAPAFISLFISLYVVSGVSPNPSSASTISGSDE